MLLHPPQRSLLIQQPRIKHPFPLNLITRQESKRTQLLIISLCSSPLRHKVFTHSVLNTHPNKPIIVSIHQTTQILTPIPSPISASMNVHKHGQPTLTLKLWRPNIHEQTILANRARQRPIILSAPQTMRTRRSKRTCVNYTPTIGYWGLRCLPSQRTCGRGRESYST
jgi:hypothetical protein